MTQAAPLIVTALFGTEDFTRLDTLRRAHFPLERNHISAHLTMFHHLAPDLLPELKRRLGQATRGIAQPRAWLAGVMNLGRGVAFRVESPDLEAIRHDLADAFGAMLTPQDAAGWRPHVTIQNKAEPAVARALLHRMQADFERRPLAIAGLATWWYRGGPWKACSRHMFG